MVPMAPDEQFEVFLGSRQVLAGFAVRSSGFETLASAIVCMPPHKFMLGLDWVDYVGEVIAHNP